MVLASVSTYAWAETPTYAQDIDQAVAIEKANLLAIKGAQSRGTCMSYYAGQNTCTAAPDNKWECRAAYSKYHGSCKGASTFADDIRESIEILNELCSHGRESACAAAAAVLL